MRVDVPPVVRVLFLIPMKNECVTVTKCAFQRVAGINFNTRVTEVEY